MFVFADEAGNFDFSRNPGASEYFTICTVTSRDTTFGDDLLRLRRDLAWQGKHLNRVFHATEDPQAIRDEVLKVISAATVRVDATLLEKRKAMPHLQSETHLYKMAWFLHFKYVALRILSVSDRLLVAAASVGTRGKQKLFLAALEDVVQQVAPCSSYRVAFWPYQSDPCLWAADYFTWAVQRKHERGDDRSYRLVAHQVNTVFRPWRGGAKYYY